MQHASKIIIENNAASSGAHRVTMYHLYISVLILVLVFGLFFLFLLFFLGLFVISAPTLSNNVKGGYVYYYMLTTFSFLFYC